MSKTTKIFGSLLNSVLNHIGDGIKNVIENTEITQETDGIDENGNKTYSIHFNIGSKKLNVLDGEENEFYIKNNILISYHGGNNNVVIPDNVTEIGKNAFKNSKIHSVIIPDSVCVVGENAFCNCFELKEVDFGHNIKEIKKSAFENCYMLKSAELPETLDTLGERCFAENWNLCRVSLPNTLDSLPDELFWGCRSLESLKWPENLKKSGKNIFNECFEPDLWQYFIIENGECLRVSSERNALDPEKMLDLDVSYYSKIQSRKLLNWIWKDLPFNQNLVQNRMEFCKKALHFCACMTDGDVYAALQTIELCSQRLKSSPDNIELNDISIEIMNDILNTISGNGESWKKSDDDIKNSILSEEDMNDPIVQSIAEKTFTAVMAEINVPMTINRYHPGIFHFAAEYNEIKGYWDFVLKLEGLLRFNGYNAAVCQPLCDPEDSIDEWLCTWSKLPEFQDAAFVLLSLWDQSHRSVKWMTVLSPEQTKFLHQFLIEQKSAEVIDGWMNGEKLFALRLI